MRAARHGFLLQFISQCVARDTLYLFRMHTVCMQCNVQEFMLQVAKESVAVQVVQELRKECGGRDSTGRQRQSSAVAWSLQRYLIFAILSCIPGARACLSRRPLHGHLATIAYCLLP